MPCCFYFVCFLVLVGAKKIRYYDYAPQNNLGGPEVQAALDAAFANYKSLTEGKNADYIPVLAKVDPNLFGIALVTVDGRVFTAGDVATEVSIQSISKVFTMAEVVDEQGVDSILNNQGVVATGEAFNSIAAIERHKGAEMNPLVNPGAIAATSMVNGSSANDTWEKILNCYENFAGRKLSVLEEVYKSESASNERNKAIARLMEVYGHMRRNSDEATDIYTRQCSVGVNAKDLAVMAATLANGGRNPISKKQAAKPENVPEILSVMATAGLYEDTGKWLYKTGLPAKSGVGGGLIAVAPGKFGIAAISPPLDAAGNSVRAQRAIADVAKALRGNPLAPVPVK